MCLKANFKKKICCLYETFLFESFFFRMSCFVISSDAWHSEQRFEGIIFFKSEKFSVTKAMEILNSRPFIILKHKGQNLQGQQGVLGVILKWLNPLTKSCFI